MKPSDWDYRKIREIGTVLSGGTPSTSVSEYWNGDILWCTPTDITTLNGNKYINQTKNKITEKGLNKSSATLIPEHSLIVCTRATIGDCAINKVEMTTNQGFKCIIPNAMIEVDYLYYLILSKKDLLKKVSNGSTFGEVSKSEFEKIELLIPKKSKERKKIISVLSAWDIAIEKNESLIIAKEQLKKALMQELLTGKKRLPGFSGEWIKCSLGDITKNFSRRNKSVIEAKVYSVTNYDGFVLQSEHFEREIAGDDLSNYKIIKKGEFAYNPARINVGSIAQFNNSIGIISSLYVCFSVKQELNDVFLKNFLQLEKTKHYINSLGEGGVRIYLWYPLFSKIKIQLPPLEEQVAIANVLIAADKEIELLKSQLEFYRQQKKGLMQILLTGAVRVKN